MPTETGSASCRAADVCMMIEPSLQIVSTTVTEREGVLLWRVEWEDRSGGDGVTSLLGEHTYEGQIAPRVRDLWTLEEIYALED
jgi:hypothetical protein